MRVAVAFWIVLAFLAGRAHCAYEKEEWVSADRYAEFHVVVSASASASEKFAAAEFTDLWKKTTGFEITADATPSAGVNVWIGREGVPEFLTKWLPFDELGDEGFILQTRERGDSRQTKSNHLLILGGRLRGTLYGVYQFFEDVMGVRWLTPEFTYIPPEPPEVIRAIDFEHVPPLRYRDANFRCFVDNPKFALVHRLNGHWVDLPDEWGGSWEFAGDAFAGTFHDFVSPEEYGASHPEYFSEIDGRRIVDPARTQLDLTHPEVLTRVTAKVLERIQGADSTETVVSLSPMPNDGWNTAWAQAAIDELEGSASGSLIRFVNLVADRVLDVHPEARIETTAEGLTRTPPSKTDPAANVIVRVRTLGTDSSLPLHDATNRTNRAFRKDVQGWLKKADEVWVWDNVQNIHRLPMPHANIPLIQGNVRYLANSGVQGYFADAGPVTPFGDFEELRAYVTAKAMWDPSADWERSYFDFLLLYYGEASPLVGEYLQLISHAATRRGREMPVDSELEWIDSETLRQAMAVRDRAVEEMKGNELLESRIRAAFASIQTAGLVCPPDVEMTSGTYVLTRQSSGSLDDYIDLLQSIGMQDVEEAVREEIGEQAPPARQEIQVVSIRNSWAEIWLTPALGAAVQRWYDPRAARELLRGFENPLDFRWTWRDQIRTSDKRGAAQPLEGYLEVVESSTGSVTLRRTLEDGLSFTKTLALVGEESVLNVTYEISNPTFRKMEVMLSTVPEFWTLGTSRPEIWFEAETGWEEVDLATRSREELAEGSLLGAGVARWAARFPGKGVVIVQSWNPGAAAELVFRHDLIHEGLTMGVEFAPAEIAPGETWRTSIRYESLDRLPFDMKLTRGRAAR